MLIKPKTLYITLTTLMVGLVLLVYAVLLAYQIPRSNRLMLEHTSTVFDFVGRELVGGIEDELRPAHTSLALLARTPLLSGTTAPDRASTLPLLAAALDANPAVSAVYAGTRGGEFTLLRKLDTAGIARMQAPAGAKLALQTVDRDAAGVHGRYAFYDDKLRLLELRDRPDYDFDPRTRPWFELASAAGAGVAVQTRPYQFFTTGEAGLTLALAQAGGVVGADLTLNELGSLLARRRITPSAQLLIATDAGELIAQDGPVEQAQVKAAGRDLPKVAQSGSSLMRELWHRGAGERALDKQQSVDGREWVVLTQNLAAQRTAGVPALRLVAAAPLDELQAEQLAGRREALLITLGLMLLLLPLVHWLADRVSRPLRELARQAEAIRHFEFDKPDPGHSLIREVDRLSVSMIGMKHSLRRFLEISSALSAERDFDALLDRILRETITTANASGGSVHLLSPDGDLLLSAASQAHGEGEVEQGAETTLLNWPVNDPDSPAAPVQALRADATIELDLDWDNPAHLAAYRPVFKRLGVSRLHLLSMPLKNRQNEVVGTLTLSFAPANDAAGRPQLSESRVAFVKALSGIAAVALDNHLLMRARKELLESFIQMVAGAIDAKSPYTGGHCQRVPELTKMLARAACTATEGPYAGFQLDNDQWEALHIAAWLHDCGKVTTPEYVVDKATKLETLYNRIHEVRTRFEVLKRDATIERLEQALNPDQLARVRAEVMAVHASLDADFAFVAACNHGSENLSAVDIGRLQVIGAKRWWRTLDDTLGLSVAERRRLPERRPLLPASETLLMDRPEHIVPRPPEEQMPASNPWGFKLQPPEHLYNLGELHNLRVTRGTLTEEERYKINDHIVQTIRMLSQLPFPKHLREVPEIAGGHHERMDGRGYPRGLHGSQMSPMARMMAIADVFEALTADDRPYKKGKPLSEALRIMGRMRQDHHIDAELYELFINSGACMEYARRFLHADQIDIVDARTYLS